MKNIKYLVNDLYLVSLYILLSIFPLRYKNQIKKGSKTLFVIIPGFFESNLIFKKFYSDLKKKNVDIVNPKVNHFLIPKTQAEKIYADARDLFKKYDEIVLIGHSKGGLTALDLSNLIDEERNVKVITISTPFGYTKFTPVFDKPEIKDLSTRKYVSFYSKIDPIVIPNKSLKPESKLFEVYKLDIVGHVRILFSEELSSKLNPR